MGDGQAGDLQQRVRPAPGISLKGDLDAGPLKADGAFQRIGRRLRRAPKVGQRADQDGDLSFGQLGSRPKSRGAVIDDEAEAELVRQADGRQDVVQAVGPHDQGHFPFQHRPERFDGRGRRPVRSGLALHGLPGVQESLAQQGHRAHAGRGILVAASKTELGRFPQVGVDRGRKAQRLAAPGGVSGKADQGALAAQKRALAGGREGGGDAFGARGREVFIFPVDGVDDAQLRENGLGRLVIVAAAGFRPFHPQVSESVDQAGGDDRPGGLDDLGAGRNSHVPADGLEASAADEQDAVFDHAAADGDDPAAADGQKRIGLPSAGRANEQKGQDRRRPKNGISLFHGRVLPGITAGPAERGPPAGRR